MPKMDEGYMNGNPKKTNKFNRNQKNIRLQNSSKFNCQVRGNQKEKFVNCLTMRCIHISHSLQINFYVRNTKFSSFIAIFKFSERWKGKK